MSTNAPTETNTQGVNANTQVAGNAVTGFGPPSTQPSIPVPQMPVAAQQFVGQQAGRAQTFSGPLTPTITPQRFSGAAPKPLNSGVGTPLPKPSILNQLGSKIGAIATQGYDIGKTVGGIVEKIGVDSAKFVYRTGEYASKLGMNLYDQTVHTATGVELDNRKSSIMASYKSGNMTAAEYKIALHDLSDDYRNWNNTNDVLNNDNQQYAKDLAYNAAQTAILIVSLDASGIAEGVEKFASGAGADTAMAESVTKLFGEGAGNFFVKGGEILSKTIEKVPAFGKVIDDAGLADTLKADPSLLAQTRSAAAAVFIKKPLLYNANIAQAKDVYERMANGDYGHAMIGIGLIGVQAIGGGPFGYAREKLGIATAKLGELTFGSGSFIDELSSRIGTGDRAGIYNYLQDLQKSDPAAYENTVQRLKELEHMNMVATGGRAPEAVDRVVGSFVDSGMDLEKLTHGEVIQNGINWAESARMVQADIKAGLVEGISPADAAHYAVGRLDTAGKNQLAEMFSKVDENLSNASSTASVAQKGTQASKKEITQYASTFNVTPAQAAKDLASQGSVANPTITMADKVTARQAAWKEFADKNPNVAFTNNLNIQSKIDNMISTIEDPKELSAAIKGISTQRELAGLPEATRKALADKGFVLIKPISKDANFVPFEETSQVLHTNFAQPNEGLFANTVQPVPVLSHIGTAIEKLGLSPRDASNLTREIYKSNLADSLNELKLSKGFEDITNGRTAAENMMNQLESFARDRKIPVTDLRQLPIGGLGRGTPDGIAEALGISRNEAKLVAGALNDSMLRVPLQYRGLGDKIVDLNLNYNPAAGGYARLQGAFRYAWNPFFKWRLDTKTEVFAQLEAGGKDLSYPMINKFNELVFPGRTNQLKEVVTQLEDSHILTSGYGGEGAQDLVVGEIGAKLTKSQKMSIAGVADAQATAQGITVQELINKNPQQVADDLRILVQYPRQGVVNSPLVRTLNTVFFPTRFNVKVAELGAKALAKQSPYMQVALIKGFYNFNSWLKSDEGTAWQSAHSDVLSLVEYISPVHTLSQTLANLQGHAESVGDLGELGGLPFGMFFQMLASQGVIPNMNTPYVNPKTGDVLPDYVPNTDKARLSTALQDLIASVFTYPGQTVGLPGKASTLRKVVNAPLGVKTKDYNKIDQTASLSPGGLHESQVIKGLPQNQSPLGAPAYSTGKGIYHTPTLRTPSSFQPPTRRGSTVSTLNKSQIRALSATSTKKPKKIAQPIP